MKIAITGKGGVGKTTLAGTLSILFARDGYEVIAIDADSDMNLASTLGIKNNPKPLTEYKDLIRERAGDSGGVFKLNPKVDDIVEKYGAIGVDGVKMLTMGTIEQGGSGCMCPASAFLFAFMRHVTLRDKRIIILDMEAGIEHLGRGTTRGIDLMIVIVEPGMKSIETAGRIKKHANEIGVKNIALVINKGTSFDVKSHLLNLEVPILGEIPYDLEFVNADLNELLPVDIESPSIEAIKEIKSNILKHMKDFKNIVKIV
ncbi:MAG: AAA family ATPase [Methanosarcinaceae archaeon]|nr:AAA family ATPase [Methanosarcinaceae archaeon]